LNFLSLRYAFIAYESYKIEETLILISIYWDTPKTPK
jgi:hypothetical protein